MSLRIGQGYDIHRLVPGRPMVLAGVTVPCEVGPLGHSDGDPIAHAVIDAMFGATGNGDIGTHFPDNDEAWRGASGALLVEHTLSLVSGWRIANVDVTVITETPRLSSYREQIREGLASMLGIDAASVSVKAKSNEGLGEVGEKRAIACLAVVLVESDGEAPDPWL